MLQALLLRGQARVSAYHGNETLADRARRASLPAWSQGTKLLLRCLPARRPRGGARRAPGDEPLRV